MDSVSGKTFPTFNPVTEEKICDVAEGDKVSHFFAFLTSILIELLANTLTQLTCTMAINLAAGV